MPYGQFYLSPYTSKHTRLNPSRRPVLDLSTMEGWKAELTVRFGLCCHSYNEIHNRRVALGITCIQCTPVQLELLRRAGAMPVSSRRCGMITRREAERLVKSFLDDAAPPKLPEDFVFDVEHSCGWGCRGAFIPSRYNRYASTVVFVDFHLILPFL